MRRFDAAAAGVRTLVRPLAVHSAREAAHEKRTLSIDQLVTVGG
jgi:hypothetical protein